MWDEYVKNHKIIFFFTSWTWIHSYHGCAFYQFGWSFNQVSFMKGLEFHGQEFLQIPWCNNKNSSFPPKKIMEPNNNFPKIIFLITKTTVDGTLFSRHPLPKSFLFWSSLSEEPFTNEPWLPRGSLANGKSLCSRATTRPEDVTNGVWPE